MTDNNKYKSQLITKSGNVLYYIREDGKVYKIDKDIPRQRRKPIFLSVYYKTCSPNAAVCKILSKEVYIKTILIKAFKPKEYFKGCCIYFKDGNKYNLHIDNLEVMSKVSSGKKTGSRKTNHKLLITDCNGKSYKFNSIKDGAKFMRVSTPSIYSYISKSCVDIKNTKIYKLGYDVKFVNY